MPANKFCRFIKVFISHYTPRAARITQEKSRVNSRRVGSQKLFPLSRSRFGLNLSANDIMNPCLDLRANVTLLWMPGRKVSLENHHTRPRETVRNRPMPL